MLKLKKKLDCKVLEVVKRTVCFSIIFATKDNENLEIPILYDHMLHFL